MWQLTTPPKNRAIHSLNRRSPTEISQQILDEMSCDAIIWKELGIYDAIIVSMLFDPNIQEINTDRWLHNLGVATSLEVLFGLSATTTPSALAFGTACAMRT